MSYDDEDASALEAGLRRKVPASWVTFGCMALVLVALAPAARANGDPYSDHTIKIGILNDRSGPLSDASGEGSAVGARLAVEEFGGKVHGVPVVIVAADHQNKPDVGLTIARRWFDQDAVDVIVDIANSAVSLAVTSLAAERHRIVIHSSASADITGKYCDPMSLQWTFNTFADANALTRVIMKSGDRRTWFIIAADYAYGHASAADLRRFVASSGGEVVGEVYHPVGATDLSSLLLQAQASGASVIAIADSASDLANAVKQAAEFGVGHDGKQILVTPTVINVSDIDALGLETAQGLQGLSSFEWNRSAAARDFTKRFLAVARRIPTADQAGVYSEVRQYLKAVQAAGTDEADAVIAKLRELPVEDAFAAHGHVRADGQTLHDLYVVRIRKPAELQTAGDYNIILESVPGDQAFQTAAESSCKLLK